MSRMKVRFLGRRRDAGGVAVIAGILLSAGVLLGASALVVDVGQLYVEREELQSAADAAAMAVALDCLHGRKDACESGTNAEHFADLNSRDGQSNVVEVCGDDFVDWLATCSDAEPDNLTACIGDLPLNTTGWVKVRTSTERSVAAGSRYILSPTFAQTLAGGHNGTSVGACSLVAWGAPDVSFAFAVCENIYDEYTDDGEDLAPAPPAPGLAAYEHEFLWRPGVPYNGLCDDRGGSPYSDGRWPVRADFGWGDRDFMGDDCEVDMSHDYDTTQLAPDEPPFTPDECYFRLVDARDTTDPLPVLVYRQVSPDWFEIRGLAAFVVTGYRIEFRPDADSSITGDPCGPDTSVCISGYFTGALIPGERLKPSDDWPYGTFGAAPDWGASIMQTVG